MNNSLPASILETAMADPSSFGEENVPLPEYFAQQSSPSALSFVASKSSNHTDKASSGLMEISEIARVHVSMVDNFKRQLVVEFGQIPVASIIEQSLKQLHARPLLRVLSPQITIVDFTLRQLVQQMKTKMLARSNLLLKLVDHQKQLMTVMKTFLSLSDGEGYDDVYDELFLDDGLEDGMDLHPDSDAHDASESFFANGDFDLKESQEDITDANERTESGSTVAMDSMSSTTTSSSATRTTTSTTTNIPFDAANHNTHPTSPDQTTSSGPRVRTAKEHKELRKAQQKLAEQAVTFKKGIQALAHLHLRRVTQKPASLVEDEFSKQITSSIVRLRSQDEDGEQPWSLPFLGPFDDPSYQNSSASNTDSSPDAESTAGQENGLPEEWSSGQLLSCVKALYDRYHSNQTKALSELSTRQTLLDKKEERLRSIESHHKASYEDYVRSLEHYKKALEKEKNTSASLREELRTSEALREQLTVKSERMRAELDDLSLLARQAQRTAQIGMLWKCETTDVGVQCLPETDQRLSDEMTQDVWHAVFLQMLLIFRSSTGRTFWICAVDLSRSWFNLFEFDALACAKGIDLWNFLPGELNFSCFAHHRVVVVDI